MPLTSTQRSGGNGTHGIAASTRTIQGSRLVSVIIPALDEVSELPDTIASAKTVGAEIIVVDGGSKDGTAALARELGARVVTSVRGRGQQMAAGAAAANGEVLVFLHADAHLPLGYVEQVMAALADPGTAVGAFQLRIAAPGAGLRLVEWGVRQRCRWLSLPYGDQGLFMKAETYRRLGGFRPFSVMEDIDLVRRAWRRGSVRILASAVTVSPRTWHQRGILQCTFLNLLCAAAWFLGASPARIAQWRARRVGVNRRIGDRP